MYQVRRNINSSSSTKGKLVVFNANIVLMCIREGKKYTAVSVITALELPLSRTIKREQEGVCDGE